MTGARNLLLTGFEPFGGDAVNPSGDAVRRVAATWSERPGIRLATAILPVTFAGAAERLRTLIAETNPVAVIATGLAGGRAEIGVERVAVNLADARIPDNAGVQPVDEPVVSGGPAGAFATLPVKAIAAAIRGAGIPAVVSHTAGTFVCNHVFYTALAAVPAGVPAGFIHVPWATGQSARGRTAADTVDHATQPELPAEDIARALQIAIDVTLSPPAPDSVVGGTLH